jgi:hypothetical protein
MTAGEKRRRYRETRRRLLVDMHIPDWDERFLSRYEPGDLADAAEAVGAEGVMLYFQSHVGLCYYPTEIGLRHRAASERDLAGEALDALHARGMPVCAYYSVNFNNRAWLDHPGWRLEPAAPATVGVLPRERYGIVCLNNPDYRAFVDAQIDEIAAYPVDAFFFDMVWWNGVCTCPCCRHRYREETGAGIPEQIDWSSPDWTRFQSARERWLSELAVGLRARARRRRPDADVYHNFALGLSNWTRGVSFDGVAGHDFLGGDFYGGRPEQMLITRLMLNLTPHRPAEFMTTVARGLIEHTGLRPVNLMRTKALAALAADAAFLAIAAIDPDGIIDPEALRRIKAAFDATAPFDAFAGGAPVEDFGVYCSDYSKADAAESGRSIADAPAASAPDYPHFHALLGACRILQQAHLPFGVVTRANLSELSRWPVLILPNVERMAAEEAEAIRAYVRNGGRVYASRGTSLHDLAGGAAEDFALADLFGCHFEMVEEGRLVYARAAGLKPLAHWRGAGGRTGTMRIRPDGAETLAALTLPYGYAHPGSVSDTHWASIHSSPPWEETDRPLIVRKCFGAGEAVYSAFDLEAGDTPEHDALFLSLVRGLLPRPPAVEVETHPFVWMSAFEQTDRLAICLLNYQTDDPPLPVPRATVRARLSGDRRCRSVRRAPDLVPVPWQETEPGVIEFEAGPIELFALYLVDHDDAA